MKELVEGVSFRMGMEQPQSSGERPANRTLRFACLVIAAITGALAAWCSRTTMYPDGISYLDIGDAYWRGDWHHALNAYWSPLYSWIVGAALKFFKPSIQGEFPLVHLVNFLMYLVALGCFSFFINAFVGQLAESKPESSQSFEIGLPLWALYAAGYSVFLTSSLFLITISFVSADMLVAAVVYFASGVLLRMREGKAGMALIVVFGLALAIGYYGKTAMFPMAFAFLATAGVIHKRARRSLKPVVLALGIFLLTTAPFIAAVSISKRRPTFGDSGTINYTVNVGTVQFFMPREPGMLHPITRVPGTIEAYEYLQPETGTYPLWYDPSYWHEGIHPHFNLKRQIRASALAFAESCWIWFNAFMGLHISVAILFLYLISPKPSVCFRAAATQWSVWIPSLTGILMYGLVVIEPRYLGAQYSVLWIVAFGGVRLPRSKSSGRLIAAAILVAAVATVAVAGREMWRTSHNIGIGSKDIATPEVTEVAEALLANGIQRGDRIAVVSDWLFPSRHGAYVARLARVRIVAEARPDTYWTADETARAALTRRLADAGAVAMLTWKPPRVDPGWQPLAGTSYYVQKIGRISGTGRAEPR